MPSSISGSPASCQSAPSTRPLLMTGAWRTTAILSCTCLTASMGATPAGEKVICRHSPTSAMLRDAETPSPSQWTRASVPGVFCATSTSPSIPTNAASGAPQIFRPAGVDAVEIFVRGDDADVFGVEAELVGRAVALQVNRVDQTLRRGADENLASPRAVPVWVFRDGRHAPQRRAETGELRRLAGGVDAPDAALARHGQKVAAEGARAVNVETARRGRSRPAE